jgi:hypothetical protein
MPICGIVALAAAAELYAQAVRTMSALPQPPYVSFRLQGEGEGLHVGLTVDAQRAVWLLIQSGPGSASWTLRHRTYDYQSEIVDEVGRRYVSGRSFFDPTWYGALRALRLGMLDAQDPAPPRATPGPATPAPTGNLTTIGAVQVIGPSVYTVEDRGEKSCPSGSPGHALHLVSKQRDPLHQLSDVIVELPSMRFCMMRFGAPSSMSGFRGHVEQHYAEVGGYWIETDGLLDGTFRVLGIAVNGGVWRYRLLDLTFPPTIPPDAFEGGP